MKRALSGLFLFALISAFVMACGSDPKPKADVQEDTTPSDVADVTGEVVTDVPLNDVPDVPDEVDPGDKTEVPDNPDIPDDGPADVPDEVELPDCIGDSCEPDCIGDSCGQPTCSLSCQDDGDCLGKIPGASQCKPERCLWDTLCQDFQCRAQQIPGCCLTDDDCKDSNPCTINEKCLSDNTCSFDNDDSNPECCVNKTLLALDFEDGAMPPASKLQVVDYKPSDLVTWSITDAACASKKALYLGDPNCRTYYNGQLDSDCFPVEEIACTALTQEELCPPPSQLCDVGGTTPKNTCVPSPAPSQVKLDLVAPELNLPASALVTVTFDLWVETEPELQGSPLKPDLFQLYAKVAGGQEEVLFTTEKSKDTDGFCVTFSADLSKYAGQSIDLIWRFDTLDSTNNFFRGIYMDNVSVMTYCKICESNAECFDSDPCTVDTCNFFSNKQGEGYCSNVKQDPFCKPCAGVADCQNAGPHPDDEFCWPPICENSLCSWDPNPSCCSAVAQLDDYYFDGFETGIANGYLLSEAAGNVGWQVVDAKSYTGAGDPTADNYSMYFGNPAAENYDCGTLKCAGQFTTPYIDLTEADENAYVKLQFYLNLSTEFDDFEPEAYPEDNAHTSRIDVLYVEVVTTDGMVAKEVWNSDVVHGSTRGNWEPQWADLTDFRGQKVALRFRFDTGDVTPPNNNYGGAFVDELKVLTVCEPICSGPKDCPAATDCSSPVCSEGRCGTELIEDCCTATVNPTCDDGDPCTVDTCNVGAKMCSHSFSSDPNCCTPYPQLLLDSFVALTADQWSLPNAGALCGNGLCGTDETCLTCPQDCNQCMVSWRVSDKRSSSAPYALYFGNQADYTYMNGALAAVGSIVSPAVELPPYGVPAVSFKLWLDTEHVAVASTFVEPNEYDTLHLYVESSDDGMTWTEPVEIWTSMSWDLKGSTFDLMANAVVWKEIKVGMSKLNLNSKFVRFKLHFDSFDPSSNNYEGAYIDDFKVYTLCDQQYECLSPVECTEATPSVPSCSMETCVAGKCGSMPNTMKPGCCNQTVLSGGSFDFDGPCGLESWKAEPSVDSVMWQAFNGRNKTSGGQCALYFGNSQTKTYDKGGSIAAGKVTSPAVNVTDHSKIQVSFWMYVDVVDLSYMLDAISLQVDYVPAPGQLPINTPVTIWAKPCSTAEDSMCLQNPVPSPCNTLGCANLPLKQWVQYNVTVDFASSAFNGWIWEAFGGKYAVFKFVFNSGDAVGNNAEGIYVDDFQVKSICQ